LITAADIVESEVWKEAHRAMHADLVAQFEAAESTNDAMLRAISLRMHALQNVVDELERRMSRTTGLQRINGKV